MPGANLAQPDVDCTKFCHPVHGGRLCHVITIHIDMNTRTIGCCITALTVMLYAATAHCYTAAEVRCLASNMFQEASGESIAGMLAVGHTTLRRSHSRSGVKKLNVCSVVHKPRAFSWTSAPRHMNEREYKKAKNLAVRAIRTFTVRSWPATHFHAVSSRPYWARSMRLYRKVGRHLFYVGVDRRRHKKKHNVRSRVAEAAIVSSYNPQPM